MGRRDAGLAGEDLTQRLEFNRVAQRRAGSVRFNVSDLFRLYAGGIESPLNDRPLAFDTRRCVTDLGISIIINGRSADDRMNMIAVGHGLFQPLQNNQARAAAGKPFPARMRRKPGSVRRAREYRFLVQVAGRRGERDAAREGHIAFDN